MEGSLRWRAVALPGVAPRLTRGIDAPHPGRFYSDATGHGSLAIYTISGSENRLLIHPTGVASRQLRLLAKGAGNNFYVWGAHKKKEIRRY